MKSNLKRLLAFMLAAMLIMTVFAACGKSGNSSTASTGDKTSQTESTPASTASTGQDDGEIPEFKIIAKLNTATEDLNENPIYQQMAEAAGVKITYECINSGWSDKKAALLASNDLPDAFIGWSVLSNSDVTNNSALFANMEELITEENTPNLKAFMDSNDYYRSLVTEMEGGIYFLSDQALFRPATYVTLMMNSEWLKKLNLEAPTTVEEFKNVLIAFRDKDPNGNGEKDELPAYVAASDILRGAFGCQGSLTYDNLLRVEDGKVVFLPTSENYKEYVKCTNDFRNEGLFPDEALTAGWDQMSARMGNDIPIVGYAECWIKDPINVEYQDQYDAILPLKGPNGDQYIAGNQQMSTYDGVPKFVMSAGCENKEALMRFVDQMFIPINSAQLARGPIGLTLSENGDGKLVINDPPEGMDWDTWIYKCAMKESIPTMGGEAVESLFVAPDPAAELKLEIDKSYAPYVDQSITLPTLKFTADESDEMSLIWTDVTDYVSTSFADWFINGGVDESWDAYVAELENMGLSRALEIYQAAYDRQK